MKDDVSTKDRLAQSFKELLLEKPFNKITIREIAEGAGVIRPTFYNYYHDKNEVFEYILDEELFNPLYELTEEDLLDQVVDKIFSYFSSNLDFYKKAFQVEGQNSFEEILADKLYNFMLNIFQNYEIYNEDNLSFLTPRVLARYYSMATVIILRLWLDSNNPETVDVEAIEKSYKYLARHSLVDILRRKE